MKRLWGSFAFCVRAVVMLTALQVLASCASNSARFQTVYYPSGAKEEAGLAVGGDSAIGGPGGMLGSRVGRWTAWYEDGVKKWEGDYLHSLRGGLRTGLWVYWHPNGVVAATGLYDHDYLDGVWFFTAKSGKEVARCDFSKGSGRYVENHVGGGKKMEGQFDRNMPNGTWTLWWPNGQKQAEGTCRSGSEDGLWTFWTDRGEFSRETLFDWKRTGPGSGIPRASHIAE